MGTPVICPHCNNFFVSDNEPGNPFALCPHCGRWMNIAPVLNRRKRKKRPHGPAKCPHCGAEMAPGSDTCLRCKRKVITGEKLPLLRRLALVPMGTKMVVLCSVLAGLIVVVVLVNLAVTYLRSTGRPSAGPTIGTEAADVIAARGVLGKLLAAENEAEQVRLGAELGKVGVAAVPLILEAVEDADLSEGARRGLIVALGDIGDPRGADVAAEAMRDRRLRQTAMVSLALMGDVRAASPIIDRFVDQFRQATLLDSLADRGLVPTELDSAVLERTWSDRLTRLHKPIASLGKGALPRLLALYWQAWQWPTRDRGRRWLDQVNRIAGQMSLEGGTVNDALVELLTGESPEVRLAAAMLLSKRRAGGSRAAEQWAGKLADLLADRRREVRERAVWTVAAITGKAFGRFGADKPPTDVPPVALTETAEWLRGRTGADVKITPAILAEQGKRPAVHRRTYHPARAQARKRVEGLAQADWPTARARRRELAKLPADAAPVVRRLLEADVRQLSVPARLIALELLAQWRDREAVRLMGRLSELLDNPAWMPTCVAVAQASASRDKSTDGWFDRVTRLDPDLLRGKDPDAGFVPADLGRLIAPQGRHALVAIQREGAFQDVASPLSRVKAATIDAMVAYGWPASQWSSGLGGR